MSKTSYFVLKCGVYKGFSYALPLCLRANALDTKRHVMIPHFDWFDSTRGFPYLSFRHSFSICDRVSFSEFRFTGAYVTCYGNKSLRRDYFFY